MQYSVTLLGFQNYSVKATVLTQQKFTRLLIKRDDKETPYIFWSFVWQGFNWQEFDKLVTINVIYGVNSLWLGNHVVSNLTLYHHFLLLLLFYFLVKTSYVIFCNPTCILKLQYWSYCFNTT